MAGRVVVSKLTHNEANVKVVGTAASDTGTIALATTLLLAGETLGTPVVNIDKVFWSIAPSTTNFITITRNSVVIATLFSTGEMNLNAMGMTEDEGNGSDIVITFAGGAGNIYLKLKKVEGYGD